MRSAHEPPVSYGELGEAGKPGELAHHPPPLYTDSNGGRGHILTQGEAFQQLGLLIRFRRGGLFASVVVWD